MDHTHSVPDLASDAATLVDYFHSIAHDLFRPVGGVLRHPSLSVSLPGATYSTHLWDWDTYWTGRGLLELAAHRQDAELGRESRRHLRGSLDNFLAYQGADGRVALLITDTCVDPFGCLASVERNQAKPIMAQIARLCIGPDDDRAWLAAKIGPLVRFIESWDRHYRSPTGLLVWGNDVTIGVDNDPTTYGRPPFSSAHLLLNCLYHQELIALADLFERLGDDGERDRYRLRADRHAELINRHCWDARDRFYYTVDVQCADQRARFVPGMFPAGMPMSWSCLPMRFQMFTGFLPLWCGFAGPEQARELVHRHYANDASFRAAAGVRSLSALEPMYSLEFSSNPSNWLGPTWTLTNYLVWKGLCRYSYLAEADELAARTIHLLARDVAASGTLHEYYHPDTGQPLSHAGFIDWNLLVVEMIRSLSRKG